MKKKERRIKAATVRLTAREYDDLLRVAELCGQSQSDMIREAIRCHTREFLWGFAELDAIIKKCKQPEKVRSYLRSQGIPIRMPGDPAFQEKSESTN